MLKVIKTHPQSSMQSIGHDSQKFSIGKVSVVVFIENLIDNFENVVVQSLKDQINSICIFSRNHAEIQNATTNQKK